MIPLDRYAFVGDVNIGNHALVTEAHALVPEQWKASHHVASAQMSVANTSLIGLCLAGNASGLVVPNILREDEKTVLEQHDLVFSMIDTAYTCLGNMICANDYGALIGEELAPFQQIIEDTLGVPVTVTTIAGLSTVGSCCVATNHGFLAHRGVTAAEMDKIKKALHVEGGVGSVNSGSPFIRSGIVANTHKVIIGDATTGPELTRIQETLCVEEGD